MERTELATDVLRGEPEVPARGHQVRLDQTGLDMALAFRDAVNKAAADSDKASG